MRSKRNETVRARRSCSLSRARRKFCAAVSAQFLEIPGSGVRVTGNVTGRDLRNCAGARETRAGFFSCAGLLDGASGSNHARARARAKEEHVNGVASICLQCRFPASPKPGKNLLDRNNLILAGALRIDVEYKMLRCRNFDQIN